MQIITEGHEARAFLNNFRQTLENINNWKDWSLLDITARPPLDWIKQAKATTVLRALLPDNDGSIVWLDESLLVVKEKLPPADHKELLSAFYKSPGLKGLEWQIEEYSIYEEQERVAALLESKHRERLTAEEQNQPNYNFLKRLVPDIDVLLKSWHAESQVWEGREKPLLMVVDDDPFTLKLVSQALSKENDVISAKDGAEAITKHLQQRPDIIFLDIGLPDCDGITILNYMKQYDEKCRIVMFSADTFLKTRMKAFAGGAKGFLRKPFNIFAFQEHISAWLSDRKHDKTAN